MSKPKQSKLKPKRAAKTAKPTRTKKATAQANGPAKSYLYTPKLADEICKRLTEGESLNSICKSEGMPSRATVHNWTQDKSHAFGDRYARAREVGYHILADDILEIADDGRNDYVERDGVLAVNHDHIARSRLRVDARKWLLSKMLPNVYGDKIQHQGGDPDKPIMHKHGIAWMTKEQAEARGWA